MRARKDWTLEALLLVYLGASLLHYLRAPMGAHIHGMNFTIWFEVIAAGVLLIYLLATAKKR